MPSEVLTVAGFHAEGRWRRKRALWLGVFACFAIAPAFLPLLTPPLDDAPHVAADALGRAANLAPPPAADAKTLAGDYRPLQQLTIPGIRVGTGCSAAW